MPFVTRVDYSDNRQVKQFQLTNTTLSGATEFGVEYSGLTNGVDDSTVITTGLLVNVASTFSGNSFTTNFLFGNSLMNSGIETLVPITSLNSGTTQQALGYIGKDSIEVDGNSVFTSYTGSTFDLTVTSIEEVGFNQYTGTTNSSNVILLSGGSTDFTGRPIWVDVKGITRTNKLILKDEPEEDNLITKVLGRDSDGNIKSVSLTGSSANFSSIPNTFFVSQTGNDLTGEYENKNRPFLTLDAALVAYKAEPDASRIFILDDSVYSFDQDLNGIDIEFYSDKACTISIENTSGLIRYLNTLNGSRAIYNFNIPLGTVNLTPDSVVRCAINSTDAVRFIMNVNVVNMNHNFGINYSRYYDVNINVLNSTRVGSQALLGSTTDNSIESSFFCESIFANGRFSLNSAQVIQNCVTHINYIEYNELIYLTGLSSGITRQRLIIGNLNNIGTNRNLILSGNIDLIFLRENPFIGLDLRFYTFNSGLNDLVVKDSDINFGGNDILYGLASTGHTVSFERCTFKTKGDLTTYRHRGTITLNNTTIVCNKLSEGNTGAGPANVIAINPLFKFEGNNVVIIPDDGDAIISEFDATLSSYIEVNDGVLTTNGVIDPTVTMNKGYDCLTNFSECFSGGTSGTTGGVTGDFLPLSGGTLTGTLVGTSFVKSGGTADDILLADGTITSLSAITLQVNNTIFIDATNGNDLTGEYENPQRPFQTFIGAISALPIDDGSLIFINYYGDLIINDIIPNRNLYFISDGTQNLTIDYSGNVYDNSLSGNSYNVIGFISPYGNIIVDDGDFLGNKTKVIVDCDKFITGGSGAGVSGSIFTDVEGIEFKANSCELPTAGIATIVNIGIINTLSKVNTGNMIFTPLNSVVVLDSNVSALLETGKIDVTGTQAFSLGRGFVNLNINDDIINSGTGSVKLFVGEAVDNIINFNSVSNLQRVGIPVLGGYSRIVLTGYVENWNNGSLNIFSATNFLSGGTIASSVELIDLTINNYQSDDTFFYEHSNIQSSVYTRFKFIAKNFTLKTNNRFLSVSNRAVNFELTNCIIEDIGSFGSPSITRGDGLTTPILIKCNAPNYIPFVIDKSIDCYFVDPQETVVGSHYIIYDVSQDTFSAATTVGTTIVKSYSVPANTFRDGDMMVIKMKLNRITGSGNPGVSLLADGVNTFVNLVNGYTLDRHVIFKDGNYSRFNTSGSFPQDLDSAADQINFTETTAWDLTTDFNIDLRLQFSLANTDEFKLVFLSIERIRNSIIK